MLPYRNALVTAKAAAIADLGLPFRERGRMSDDYIRAIKAAFGADMPAMTRAIERLAREVTPAAA